MASREIPELKGWFSWGNPLGKSWENHHCQGVFQLRVKGDGPNQLCHCHRLRYIKSCSHVFTSNVFLVPGQALKHGWPGKLHVSIWSCFSWIILCRWMDVPPRSFPGPASQRRRAEDSFPAKVFLVQLSGRAGYFLGISKVDVHPDHPGQYVIYSTFMW